MQRRNFLQGGLALGTTAGLLPMDKLEAETLPSDTSVLEYTTTDGAVADISIESIDL
jgi:hypothetical protein